MKKANNTKKKNTNKKNRIKTRSSITASKPKSKIVEDPLQLELKRRMLAARNLAETAWCDYKTSKKEIDNDLLETFTNILYTEMYEPHLWCASSQQLLDELNRRLTESQEK